MNDLKFYKLFECVKFTDKDKMTTYIKSHFNYNFLVKVAFDITEMQKETPPRKSIRQLRSLFLLLSQSYFLPFLP